jgi:RHS repeat-associated protein
MMQFAASVTQRSVGIPYKFTGKERDAESGLDEFGARYYGSSFGRFMTPDWAAKPTDVPYANFGNPQSLNLYSYVNNNPTTTRDPDGHCPPCDDGFWDFAGAAANAYGSDNLLGAGRTDQPTNAGRIGAAVGDFAATVQGGAEALFGGGVEVGGVALDATGVGAVAGVPANVAGAGLMLHGGATAETGFSNLFKSASDASHKGATTEPTLPSKTVASDDGVTVQHFTRSGDHGPAHLHVEGNGPSTRIGMNGKPLKGDAELSSAQKAVVDNNKGAIRSAVDKIQRWFKFNNQ